MAAAPRHIQIQSEPTSVYSTSAEYQGGEGSGESQYEEYEQDDREIIDLEEDGEQEVPHPQQYHPPQGRRPSPARKQVQHQRRATPVAMDTAGGAGSACQSRWIPQEVRHKNYRQRSQNSQRQNAQLNTNSPGSEYDVLYVHPPGYLQGDAARNSNRLSDHYRLRQPSPVRQRPVRAPAHAPLSAHHTQAQAQQPGPDMVNYDYGYNVAAPEPVYAQYGQYTKTHQDQGCDPEQGECRRGRVPVRGSRSHKQSNSK